MKYTFLVILLGLLSKYSIGQTPEDALKYSWYGQNGTARNLAAGGVMGSLGGDITATFTNPAGLGLYKTGEFVLTPGVSFLNNKSNFRETPASAKKTAFNLGPTGFVFGFNDNIGKWRSKAISLVVTRSANFNSNVFYKGENNYSSYSEQYAEEISRSGADIDYAWEDPRLSIGSRMAAYTYLVDTITVNGEEQVIGVPEFLSNRHQQDSITTHGGITDIALGLAGNMNDKFYLGGTIGLSVVNYEKNSVFKETDPSGLTDNFFNSSEFDQLFTTKGVGINLKLGMIVKPADNIRLGFALHSPTFYGLKDTYEATMTNDLENYVAGIRTVNMQVLTGQPNAVYEYNYVSPWKAMISGSYVLREIEDVTKQRGFVSADLEYVNYKASSYSQTDNGSTDGYYGTVNSTIDDIYKGNINVKVGGELKFNTIMARAGFSYYGSPYAEKELEASRKYVSAGLGYRDKGIFIDLTYVYAVNKDVQFPYRLEDKANTYAAIRGRGDNAVLTVGFKF
jgi:hypothetical protein